MNHVDAFGHMYLLSAFVCLVFFHICQPFSQVYQAYRVNLDDNQGSLIHCVFNTAAKTRCSRRPCAILNNISYLIML